MFVSVEQIEQIEELIERGAPYQHSYDDVYRSPEDAAAWIRNWTLVLPKPFTALRMDEWGGVLNS